MSSLSVEFEAAIARSALYKLLAKSFLYPDPASHVYEFIQSARYEDCLSRYLDVFNGNRAGAKTAAAVQDLLNSRREMHGSSELEPEYNRLFAHFGSAKCPPYETEYGCDNIFQKTDAMADIAGFYRAYELQAADTHTERVDFIGTELEFMSFLALSEAYAREHGEREHLDICVDTQRKFIRDHLGRWSSVFTASLSTASENRFYVSLGVLTEQFIEDEAHRLEVELIRVTAPGSAASDGPEPLTCEACVGGKMQARNDP
jgi:TorA maturation chaperone TorD